jgi:hypothetical protein
LAGTGRHPSDLRESCVAPLQHDAFTGVTVPCARLKPVRWLEYAARILGSVSPIFAQFRRKIKR